MIKAKVTATAMSLEVGETLTEGRVGLECGFEFSPEWDGLVKTAVFEGVTGVTKVLTDDAAVIPPDVFADAAGCRLRISVTGRAEDGTVLIPTVWAIAGRIEPSGANTSYPESTWEPTADIGAQVESMAANALTIAQGVRADADAGKFDGAAGESGAQGERGEKGEKGDKGDAGTFDSVTASVDSTTGTPAVVVSYDGANASFAFSGLKGEQGEQGEKGEKGDKGDAGEGAVDSVNGQTGAVVLAASDVGAVPTTRTVCGKELSSDITLSASNVGARSSTWMPTAAQVGARADTWLPSETEVVSDIATIRSGAALGATALQSVPSTYRTAAAQDAIHDSTKQDTISDLAAIRSGAALGATALQSYTETDPTVPDWAKADSKPTYTASEVGAMVSDYTKATSWSYPTVSMTNVSTASVSFYKVGQICTVTITLKMSVTGASYAVVTLPEGFRPPTTVQMAMVCTSSAQPGAATSISTAGVISVYAMNTNMYTGTITYGVTA